MAGRNRENQKQKQALRVRDKHNEKVDRGNTQLVDDKKHDNDWNLDWFRPRGLQQDCEVSFKRDLFTVINAPSGCGKTTTALWWALSQLRSNNYQQLIFLKNPTEVGDDKIGFLSGSESDKLMAHMDTTKRIFHEFVSKGKLEVDMSKDKIRLTIPNFLLGATFDNSIVIIDECQNMSPNTIKLLLERCGKNTKYILLGDKSQRYAVTKRADGFEDFISRTTISQQGITFSRCEPMVGYVKMSRHDNQRSDGSAFINKIYDEEEV